MAYKLASERLNTGGPTRGLVPSLLNDVTSRAGTPHISGQGANVRYTPVPIPEIVVDSTLSSGAKMASIWSDAAYTFQQRQEKADAESAAIAAQQIYGDEFYGTADTPGYESKLGAAAVKGIDEFSGRIRRVTSDTLDLLTPGAKVKAMTALKVTENMFLRRGAKHKAVQQRVWEQDIIKAQYGTIMREAIASSKDPVEFGKGVTQAVNQLSSQFIGRPEALKVATQSFVTDVINKVVKAQLDLGNLDLAETYINLGSSTYGIDSIVTADLIARHAKTTAQLNAAEDSAGANAIKKMKQRNFLENDYWTKQAVKNRDPLLLKNITDLGSQVKAKAAYAKYIDVVTDPDDKVAMYANIEAYVANPSKVFEVRDQYNVSFTDRQALYGSIRADRNAGVEGLKRQAREMTKAVLVDASVNDYGEYIQAAVKKQAYIMNKAAGVHNE